MYNTVKILKIRYFSHTSKRYRRRFRNINFLLIFKELFRAPLIFAHSCCTEKKLRAKIYGFKVDSLMFRHDYYPNHGVVQAPI